MNDLQKLAEVLGLKARDAGRLCSSTGIDLFEVYARGTADGKRRWVLKSVIDSVTVNERGLTSEDLLKENA